MLSSLRDLQRRLTSPRLALPASDRPLTSCSPCFQEFKEFRRQSAVQRRRVVTWVATAAVLLLAVGGWLWVRGRHAVETTDTAVLDLRENEQSPPLETDVPRYSLKRRLVRTCFGSMTLSG